MKVKSIQRFAYFRGLIGGWSLILGSTLGGSLTHAQEVSELAGKSSAADPPDWLIPGTGTLKEMTQGSSSSAWMERLSLNYFATFYGPSVSKPSSHQVDSVTGEQDLTRPVALRNLLGLSYAVSDQVSVTPSVSWSWEPVLNHATRLEDPFLKVAHHSLISFRHLNLYADARVHFPVSSVSQDHQMLFGLQSVQVITYEVENTHFTLGLYGSGRYNAIRSAGGRGNDFEWYLGPNLSYQVHPRLALTLLYEVRNSHAFGDRTFAFQNDEMDIEPGLSWDVNSRLMLSPYLHIPTQGPGLAATSVGMMMNWTLF